VIDSHTAKRGHLLSLEATPLELYAMTILARGISGSLGE